MNMKRPMSNTALLAATVWLTACASSLPQGPSVAVMPAQGKPFEVFQQDHWQCKDFASREAGISQTAVAQSEMVQAGVAGAVVGAAAGAAIGDNSRAAATGAGVGAVLGVASGAGNARRANSELQRRYDIAYQQCMYAKGNQLPQASDYYREVTTVRTVPADSLPLPPNLPPPPPY